MKEKIYKFSPIWLKTILLNIKASSNIKKRFSKDYYHYLEEYNGLWKAKNIEILNYQKKQLIQLLTECYQYSPFYQERFKDLNISLDEIRNKPFIVLTQLPLLSKEDRKSKVDSLINQNPNRPTIGIGHTSGTSGSPTVSYLDKESTARAFALWSRFHHNIGLDWKDKSIRFSGHLIISPTRKKPPFWIYNSRENQLFMSPYHLKKEYLKYYIEKLNSFKPLLLDGYPSAIYVIANFINQQSIQLNFKPKAIAVTAETFYDYQRIEIEKAFNCKVYNQYASSEGSPFITECVEGKLHINEDSGVFEFLNKDNQPAKPGEIGRMVVTSFRSWKTPLLRYDILDTVLLPTTQIQCNCGCHMPYVEKLIGREDDVLWTEDKGNVGRMDVAYKGLKGIVKSQLIQPNKDTLIVNQIVDEDYSKQMNKLFIQKLKDHLGESIEIKINIVEDIPLGSNGKFDAVKREFEIPE